MLCYGKGNEYDVSPSVKNHGDVAVLYSFCSENYIADFMTNKSAMSLFNNENIMLRADFLFMLNIVFYYPANYTRS